MLETVFACIQSFLLGCAIGCVVWLPLLVWIRIENGPFRGQTE